MPSTFTVINTSSDSSNSGSLPWAVQQANSTPGTNTINFNIPGSGMQIININSTLSLTNPVNIDGTSQPGYNGTPLISVQGNASVGNLFVLDSGGSGSTIQGLDMFDYTFSAVEATPGTSGEFIQNNWVGFFRDPTTGQVSLDYNLGSNFNNDNGLVVWSNNGVIRNNVIDGTATGINVGISFHIGPSGGNSNWIQGNIIGLNASQTAVISSGNYGIYLSSGSTGNHVLGNVIGGASQAGVVLSNASTNFVNENWIGESATGKGFPNGYYGVDLLAGSNNNYIAQNSFGPNGVGSVYVDPNAVGNYIGYTPQPTPSSFSAQIQQLFGYYPLMVQAVQTGNVDAFVQALESYVTLYAAVELEILNSVLRS